MNFFAERLRTLRTNHGYSIQDLAELAGLSEELILNIERGDEKPSLEIAARLASAFNTTLSDMLHTAQLGKVVHLTPDEQAFWEDSQHIQRRTLSPVLAGLKVEWVRVSLPPGVSINFSPGAQLAAEKFIFVVKGLLDARIGGQNFHLKKNESLYFDGSLSQSFINPGKHTAEYHVIIRHF